MTAIVIQLLDVAVGRCCCATCCRLDRRYPLEGYQLGLALPGSEDRPETIPLPVNELDAPAAAIADVSEPFRRPVETRSRPNAGAAT